MERCYRIIEVGIALCMKEEEIMISAGDFRNGITIELEGNIYQIIEFQHVKPGKGAAFVRTRPGLTEKITSIFTQTVICLTLWTWRRMTRLP